ncbi:MAG: hypothetical protein OEY28_07125 [Nitrospira sp.]|nr:hypothetical protein [Nitrospira sp.]
MSSSLIILGAGYTARVVWPLAVRRYAHVLVTSREPDRHLSEVPSEQRIRFDLTQKETWKNIPSAGDLLWCFPTEPLGQVQACAAAMNLSSRRLVVLGSTSAYPTRPSNEYPPPWIDETAGLDESKPRVLGEEYLRRHCHAIVLMVAGIYGPGRNPLDWIKKGRVGPSRKYVNLIHVEDLAEVCLTALEHGMPGETYNVSDGTPRTWEDICRMARDRWGIESVRHPDDRSMGKRLSAKKLLSLLEAGGTTLDHADLFGALDCLRSERSIT